MTWDEGQARTLVDLLRGRAELAPARLAFTFLVDGGSAEARLTYGELDLQARAIATRLRARMPDGGRALLMYEPSLDYVTGFFACIYAGICAVPAYPPSSARRAIELDRLANIARRAGASLALTTGAVARSAFAGSDSVSEMGGVEVLRTDEVADAEASGWAAPDVKPESVAVLQFTSGSTGRPRGVMLSHENILAQERMIKRTFRHGPETVSVGWAPLFHDLGLIGNVLHPVYLGAHAVLMPPLDFLQRPARWLHAISQYRARTSGGPNFAFDLCVARISDDELADVDLTSWSVAYNASEPVRWDTCERFARRFEPFGFRREALRPAMGLAEASLMVSAGPLAAPIRLRRLDRSALARGDVVRVADDAEGWTVVGCGELLHELEAQVVDPETLERCAPGRVGEIWLRGPNIALGYADDPAANEATFGGRIAGSKDGPFLRTGDLGFIEGRELYITGRRKDVIVVHGRNHYPEDLERSIERAHACIRPGCGAAISVDSETGEEIVVVQEVDSRLVGDPEEVFARIRETIGTAHGLRVHHVVLIEAKTLPKTSSGKLARSRCREAYLGGRLAVVSQSGRQSLAAPVAYEAALR